MPVSRKNRSDKLDFEGMIAKGEVPTDCGMRAVTSNGESRCFGSGWNQGGGAFRMDVQGTTAPTNYGWTITPKGAWAGKRTNRWGE